MHAYYRMGSIANAIRAKRVLESHGIHAYIRRRTDNEGCGYLLMVTNDSPAVAMWLRNSDVAVYRQERGE